VAQYTRPALQVRHDMGPLCGGGISVIGVPFYYPVKNRVWWLLGRSPDLSRVLGYPCFDCCVFRHDCRAGVIRNLFFGT
jgi:hypothetical protein